MPPTPPSTPPRTSSSATSSSVAGPSRTGNPPPTPDDVRRLEENRLRAKARLQERDRERRARELVAGGTGLNAFNKRPLEVVPAESTSPTAPNGRSFPTSPYARNSNNTTASTRNASHALNNVVASSSSLSSRSTPVPQRGRTASATPAPQQDGGPQSQRPLPRDARLGKYFEYDLSTLRNSKGGFLVEDEDDEGGEARKRQRLMIEEQRQKRRKEMEAKGVGGQDPAISLDPRENPKCKICGSVELDFQFLKVFGVPVCPKCKGEHPEQFSLLTKTECKEDYLLTDPELRDEEILPHLLRPNPHRPTYSNMMLFLRCQVEAFAFSPSKWGSPEALDAEFERRQGEKKKKKGKKFEEALRELRKKTRRNEWHRRKEEEHRHKFEFVVDGEGGSVQRCEECGLEVEAEQF